MDIGYAGALLGGVLTLLSPCSAVLLPSFFAYAFTSDRTIIGRTLLFWVGLLTTLVPLGVAASTLGFFFSANREAVVIVASIIIIVFGAMQVLGIGLPVPGRKRARGRSGGQATSSGAVYVLGTVYGIAGVCSGPILGSVLAVAAVGGNPLYGGTLLAVYALGMVLPVIVLSVVWQRFDLGRRTWLRPRPIRLGPATTTLTSLVSGLIFIALGVLLLATSGTANLGGVLSIDDQFRAESAVTSWSTSVPDLAVVATLAVGTVIVALVLARARAHPTKPSPPSPPPRFADATDLVDLGGHTNGRSTPPTLTPKDPS
ncbi:cytochrome c biogenesis CcdA family protein [Propionibacteriaceae bacterium Y2011]